MNAFSPYVVIEDTPSTLHLKESNFRAKVHLFILRFFPFLYALFVILFLILKGGETPATVSIFMISALVIPALLIFNAKFILEVSITKIGVDVTYNAFFKQQERSYPIAFIDHIYGRRRGGKAPAYIYYVVTKSDNKKEKIMKIPALYMSKEKQSVINNKLETLTGLKVVTNRTRIF